MSYRHIPNLYKETRILSFKKVFATEKVHGTSAHVSWKDGKLIFFSGGCRHDAFVALFNQKVLTYAFMTLEHDPITIYGEAYGGKLQKMKETYGDQLRFVAFEVKIGDIWLAVPQAHNVAINLGFDFVHYEEVETDIDVLDALCKAPSVQAIRNGCGDDKPREGIVLRPPFEVRLNNNDRLIVKHKNPDFAERVNPPKVGTDLKVLQEAEAIADEWVTKERIRHVIDALHVEIQVENIGPIIKGMTADIAREAAGEIVVSDSAWKSIAKKTALTIKEMCQARLREEQ